MKLPPYGICIPCVVRRVIDGDTLEVSVVGSERRWRIRLLDCWAPELRTPEGKQAKAAAEDLVDAAESLSLFIPAPKDAMRLWKTTSMGRLLGHIYLRTDETLNEAMVRAGHATREKPR